jgi:hypothetical protein
MTPRSTVRTAPRLGALLAVLAAAGCRADAAPAHARASAQASAAPTAQCQVMEKGLTLPDDLKESSGIAPSRLRRGIFWTHNDSGHGADLFAIDATGRELGRVQVRGATNHDWEDIAAGPCPTGGGACLYVADTGDNARDNDGKGKHGNQRHTVRLVVLPEPDPRAPTADAQEYEAQLPANQRTDIEALAVLPDGRVYLVSKGIHDEVALFRWPTPLVAGPGVTLERIRTLAPRAQEVGDRVTGASATPNGQWVAVRTYAALAFYRTADLLGSGRPVAQLDLEPLGEPQGEAVSLADDGTVFLTSEGPGRHLPGTLARLRCLLPR